MQLYITSKLKITKALIIVILLFICNICFAQIYSGNTMGYSNGAHTVFNYNINQNQVIHQPYLVYSLPIGYNYRGWLIESGLIYNGYVYSKLIIGRNFKLSGNTSADLLVGYNDELEVEMHPYHLNQEFYKQITMRVIWKKLCIDVCYGDAALMIGFGFKGWLLQ
jgi:hypothetical protein